MRFEWLVKILLPRRKRRKVNKSIIEYGVHCVRVAKSSRTINQLWGWGGGVKGHKLGRACQRFSSMIKAAGALCSRNYVYNNIHTSCSIFAVAVAVSMSVSAGRIFFRFPTIDALSRMVFGSFRESCTRFGEDLKLKKVRRPWRRTRHNMELYFDCVFSTPFQKDNNVCLR